MVKVMSGSFPTGSVNYTLFFDSKAIILTPAIIIKCIVVAPLYFPFSMFETHLYAIGFTFAFPSPFQSFVHSLSQSCYVLATTCECVVFPLLSLPNFQFVHVCHISHWLSLHPVCQPDHITWLDGYVSHIIVRMTIFTTDWLTNDRLKLLPIGCTDIRSTCWNRNQ